ncbi:MAG: bifunctional diaminohydroxyphosphoribosylaminopyrimidine deaminase/5-amino-6-(5-phosphoribosylamino)uracil reductase RibD [Treponema sp.]|nr:bifunctional diaminohydroxyphosphoribosylaminopyrimidine deaminase/5-amino-6-(5-phosphoribosylamino)uracil reductase RibD [Treponema sp.]MEE3435046.1 bifunctional diaminohydroxyphosphoribosylaminopyrimidine deaminase/5-amino-6-(5-phosphoribosylamino)uracil reductase RibD [Treponema sp.]
MEEGIMENDSKERFMRAAIELAKKGEGWTNPNPLVGAVIVKENQIIGQGYHHKYGDLHAERDALRDCRERGNDPSGAQIFVTLEPCCHTGKQPPCVEAIVQAGIKKVVVGSRDPNPLVSGKGTAFLREHGVEVEEDFLRSECDALNFIFFHYITSKTPYVALKYAMTADGKIATAAGKSKWISCQESRDFVHQLRSKYSCIMAGIGTVLADDPLLTCRIPGGRNPTRIICDSSLRLPLDSQLVQSATEVPTIVACADSAGIDKEKALAKKGVQVIRCGSPSCGNRVDLCLLMKKLGELGLDSVLVEGGGALNFSLLKAGLVQRVYSFVAPKIFGGAAAPSPVAGSGVLEVADAFSLSQSDARKIGSDVLIEYEVKQAQKTAASFGGPGSFSNPSNSERICSQE